MISPLIDWAVALLLLLLKPLTGPTFQAIPNKNNNYNQHWLVLHTVTDKNKSRPNDNNILLACARLLLTLLIPWHTSRCSPTNRKHPVVLQCSLFRPFPKSVSRVWENHELIEAMHQILSYQTAMRAGNDRDGREYITRRICVSFVFSVGFFTLIAGWLVGWLERRGKWIN